MEKKKHKRTVKLIFKDKNAKKENYTTGERIKRFVSSYEFLYTLFFILLGVVILLSVMVFTKVREKKASAANLVIPILKDGVHNSMNLDLKQLYESGEYTIKITNYRGDTVNANDVSYSVTVRNESPSSIKVLQNDSKKNLIVDQEATRIEGLHFDPNEKEEVIYRFSLEDGVVPSDGDTISIEIAS